MPDHVRLAGLQDTVDDILYEYGIDSSQYGPLVCRLVGNDDHLHLKELTVKLAGRIQGKKLIEALTSTRPVSPTNNADSSSRSSSPPLNASAPIFTPSAVSLPALPRSDSDSATKLSSIWNHHSLSDDDQNHHPRYTLGPEHDEDEDVASPDPEDIVRVVNFLQLDDDPHHHDSIGYSGCDPYPANENGDQGDGMLPYAADDWTGDYSDFSQGHAELELLTPLQEFAMLFSHIPSDQILSVLESVGYDMEAALDALMPAAPQVQKNTGNSISSPAGTPKRKQICRHFLSGGCFRKDCWFSHDLETTICKYWLQNCCVKGDLCDFSHDAEPLVRAKQQQSLHGINTSNDSNSSRATPSPPPILSPVLPEQELSGEEEFPTLADAVATVQSKKSARSSSGRRKYKFVDIARKAASKPATAACALSLADKPVLKKSLVNSRMTCSNGNVGKPRVVDTGASVAKQYQDARQEAIECAIARNKLFQRATEAYKSGDPRLAKQLSLEAHAYNSRMESLHAAASSQLYSARNKSTSSNNTLDLHGLYPQEAIQMLEKRLHLLRKSGGSVWVITGTGHHSRNSQAKLGPAVREWLTLNRYSWKEADYGDGRGGCVYVEVG
ncbi:hypothetical protein SeMB42_g01700 [Synchytrium endobioticum]|uniref:Smr domain-containing protein n=1 Tax=Synchytrium endobioticum TaxID=286115 RepID=A0A507D2B5_9FUNG|nr:hypothetical protein SeLEV6574_g03881 [Synchytrium endobioticum]TPX52008.1 hypothetical protein SeMB42_g01700 [Synchytrium endobioticum]